MGAPGEQLGSAIIGGLTNLWGQSMANSANSKEAQKNRDFQREERIAAQDWNLEMWNKENEYNTPAAQMQRMIEAGINPSAAAQGISGNGNTAGSIAASQPAQGSLAAPHQNVLSGLANSVNTAWQNELIRSQIMNTDEDTEGKDLENRYNAETYEVRVAIGMQNYENMVKEGKLKDVNVDLAKQLLDHNAKKNGKELELMQKEIDITGKRIDEINQKIEESKKLIEKYESDISLNDVAEDELRTRSALNETNEMKAYYEAQESKARTRVADSQVRVNDAQTGNIQQDTELKKIQADLDKLKKEREELYIKFAEDCNGVPQDAGLGATVYHVWRNHDLWDLIGLATFVPGVGTAGKGAVKGAKTGWQATKNVWKFGKPLYKEARKTGLGKWQSLKKVFQDAHNLGSDLPNWF